MQKHTTHQIDCRGKIILKDTLPVTWSVNELPSDYGKDFHIELGESDGEMTGESLYVQLKSSVGHKFNVDRSEATFSLKSMHARYFAKVKDLPVFLVLIDVSTKVGYYLFLQRWLNENQNWKRKKTVFVGVPTKNVLSEAADLTNAINEAKVWLQSRHPKSIRDAVSSETGPLTALDSRFSVRTVVEGNRVVHQLKANSDVRVTLSAQDRIAAEKLRRFLDLGDTVEFDPKELVATGSDLIAKLQEQGCKMESNGFEATLLLKANDKIDGAIYNSPSFPCLISGGVLRSKVKTTIQSCPIDLTLVLNSQASTANVTFKFKKSIWDGLTTSKLPYFEHCLRLIQSLSVADSLEFTVEHNGNALSTIPCVNGFKDLAMAILPLLDCIKRLRRLCNHFCVDPIWNETSFLNDLPYFNRVEAIVFDKQWKGQASGVVNGVIADKKFIAVLRKNKSKPAPFNVTSDLTYTVLGVEINLGRVSHDFSAMVAKVSKQKPTGSTEQELGKAKEYMVEFRPMPKSTLLMKRVTGLPEL